MARELLREALYKSSYFRENACAALLMPLKVKSSKDLSQYFIVVKLVMLY